MEMAELSSSLKDRGPTFELFRHRSLAGFEYGLQIKCFNLKLTRGFSKKKKKLTRGTKYRCGEGFLFSQRIGMHDLDIPNVSTS